MTDADPPVEDSCTCRLHPPVDPGDDWDDGDRRLVSDVVEHGLRATTSIETLDGDGGVDLDSERPTASGSTSELSHLSGFLESLAAGPVWEGMRRWGSLGNELVVSAGVDLLGHVTLEFTVAPQPWRPSWSATCSVSSTLGDLSSTSRDLRHWVAEQT